MTQGRVDRREHWDIVYSSKPEDAVSWFQSIPEVSLRPSLPAATTTTMPAFHAASTAWQSGSSR